MALITTNLELAIKHMLAAKPVAIPTETVYGLAALIDKEEAIAAVFAMKNRPLNHPLIVHVAQDFDLSKLVYDIPTYAQQLIAAFWPGPLTLVLQGKAINPLITGGQSTVALRCPAHPMAQALLKDLKTPFVAPSANPFGKTSPTTALHVAESFPKSDLLILDGGRCSIGIESTILDATNPDHYQILRHGLIDAKTLARHIPTACVTKEHDLRVPGLLKHHYQPDKPLYYFDSEEALLAFYAANKAIAYLIANQPVPKDSGPYFAPLGDSPEQVAFSLYYQLRAADNSEAACIAIQLPPDTSAWQGIRERIMKAGTKGS